MLPKKTWVPDCVEEAAVISRDDSSHKHSTVLHIYSLLVLCPRSFLYLLCAPRLQKIYFEENHRLGYPTTTIPWAMQQQQQSFGLSMQQQQEQSLLFFLLLLLLLLLLYPSSSFCFCLEQWMIWRNQGAFQQFLTKTKKKPTSRINLSLLLDSWIPVPESPFLNPQRLAPQKGKKEASERASDCCSRCCGLPRWSGWMKQNGQFSSTVGSMVGLEEAKQTAFIHGSGTWSGWKMQKTRQFASMLWMEEFK